MFHPEKTWFHFASTRRERLSFPLALAGAAAMLTGCARDDRLAVEDAYVRLAAVPGRPAAAYFTIHGGPAPTTLISISADAAIRTEMHASMATGNGMMTMDSLQSVPVPAATEVAFAPGGRHAMLFDVNRKAAPGSQVVLTLGFADGQRIYAKARVVAAGAPAPDFD